MMWVNGIMWLQIVIGYVACGVAVYAVFILSPARSLGAVLQQVFAGMAQRLEEIEYRKNPSWTRYLKIESARWMAHITVSAVVITTWPVFIVQKARGWLAQRKEIADFRGRIKAMGVPIGDSEEITPEEKLYVLVYSIKGDWAWETEAFFDLVGPAIELMLAALGGEDDFLFDGDRLQKLYALEIDDVKRYCADHDMSELVTSRIVCWATWSKSPDAKASEEFFRRLWDDGHLARWAREFS